MNKSSSLKVFYILTTYKNKRKNVNSDIPKYVIDIYKKSGDYMKSLCKRIYNDIENSMYGYDELIIYLLHESTFSKKNILKSINKANVKKIVDLYRKKRLVVDKENIKYLKSELNIKFADLFKIDEQGGTLCFDFCREGIISPLIWILKSEKYFIRESFFTELFENDNHKTFRKYCDIIKKYLKGVYYGS